MLRPIGPGALVLALVPSFVVAQEDAVVVTASRTEQRLRDTIPHTTVLTQKEIRDSQAIDLPTLLRSEAGFEMAQTGGIGSVPSPLSLRGSTSARTLVLVDGVRIEDAGFSSTALQHIMLDQSSGWRSCAATFPASTAPTRSAA